MNHGLNRPVVFLSAFTEYRGLAYDDEIVINTVIMGHEQLYTLLMEREAIYAKTDFTEEDGIRSGELEAAFAEMNGYEAESEAAVLLSGLGLPQRLHNQKMKELEGGDKVRVLLARPFSATRMSCFLMSPPITWIWRP